MLLPPMTSSPTSPSPRSRAVLTVLALAATVLVAVPGVAGSAEPDPIPTDRVAGATRFETAAALARRAAAGRDVERVWLATGLDHPDALAAAVTGEPVLLATRDDLPSATADALADLAPSAVVAAGGTAAIGPDVLAAAGQAAGGATTARAAGPDRYATAAAVADRTHPGSAPTVWLATGRGFADALAAGPVAAAEGAPLLLVPGTAVPTAVRDALARLAPDELVVVGGTAAVTADTAREAADAAGGAAITRLAGPDRFATAVAVAERGRDRHGLDAHPYLATGLDFPDALAAGAAAFGDGGPLLLATHAAVPEPTRTFLQELAPPALTLAGGERALSATVFHRASRPWLVGACDLYDVTRPGPIQGHPENQRPSLDAWSGPWVIDDFRGAWEIAVPYRWRYDRVETLEHRGVLFYVDTEDGYDHWLSVTVFCGNPYLMGGGVVLDADDPGQIAAEGPHPRTPDAATFDGPALYTAVDYDSPEANQAQRWDYVAVDDDVILIHYLATNRFAREMDTTVARIADAVAGSVGPAGTVDCPPNAADCVRR